MNGPPLLYQVRPDGSVLLYSVGEDGVDDGGDGSDSATGIFGGKVWRTLATAKENATQASMNTGGDAKPAHR